MPTSESLGFSELAARYAAEPDVELPDGKKKGFGSATLRCQGKIFAMSPDGRALVVKLTAPRAADIIAAGGGTPYGTSKGKVMKEWVSIPPERASTWSALADEALDRSRSGGR